MSSPILAVPYSRPSAKGGIINTRHSGQVSRLYRGLCETVGLLMASETPGRQVAVVPYTEGTLRLAKRMAARCAQADIEIALVGRKGEVTDIVALDESVLRTFSVSDRHR